MTSSDKLALKLHKQFHGKITIALRDNTELTKERLGAYYTPGIGAVSLAVTKHPDKLSTYTWINNLVAVISDGSAVLGLGNLGPNGALPVLEGKAMLFKHFADIDAVPIVLNVHTADEIVSTIQAIATSFGAINLEDIAAPICFDVEDRLKKILPIPVMHDDQHGTATVTLSGLINATKLTGRKLAQCKIVISGAGAAGVAIAKLLHKYAAPDILVIDSRGIISRNRNDLNEPKVQLLKFTNLDNVVGSLADALLDADIFIGVSKPNLLTKQMISTMTKDPIIFAMANPNPEILPSDARAAGAAIIATGRSDYPNQVNNALAFPGIFRGALDNHVKEITDQHQIAAAEVIASLVKNPSANKIIPSIFDKDLVPAIAAVIR
jgi:malate dehydrogenase (oxaloacetate-decarboxylating)